MESKFGLFVHWGLYAVISQVPKQAIVLNNGEQVKAAVAPMPTAWNWQTHQSRPPYLHLFDLPIESFSHEPIVVKLVW